jgi:hypothetical protein
MDMVSFSTQQYLKPLAERDRVYRSARGITYDDDPPALRAQKLVELLDRPVGDYTPNQTMLMGVVLLYYGCVSENSMRASCTMYDLEHISGLMSLAAMCQGENMHAKGCGDGVCEQVLFALLEAAPTSMDVLMEFLVSTPYIGPEKMYKGALRNSFQQARGDRMLTPNQMTDDYCNAMKGGLGLICFLFKMDEEPYKEVWIHCLAQHSMFPLLLQRLIRIVAREVMGLNDGKKLGKYARNILADLANLSEHDFDKYSLLCESDDAGCFKKAALPAMLRADGITSIESLRAQLEEWIE